MNQRQFKCLFLCVVAIWATGCAGAVYNRTAVCIENAFNVKVVRIDGKNHRLFVAGKDVPAADIKLKLHIIEKCCTPLKWGEDWALSVFTEEKYAGSKDETRMLPYHAGNAWAKAYILEYDHLTRRFTINPATSAARSTAATHNLEKNIGLYKIVDKKCDTLKGAFNPCDTTHFLEIVKGQFFGIKNKEIGLVFWTGDSWLDPKLQYTAQLIKNHRKTKLTGDRIWLTNDENTKEYFILTNNQLNRYVLTMMGNNKKVIRHIAYTLNPTQRSNFPHVILNYPENQ